MLSNLQITILSACGTIAIGAAVLVAVGAGLIPALVISTAVTVPVALVAELVAACFE